MTKHDHFEFARVMMALSEVFDGGREPNPLKVELYFQALKEFRIEEVKEASVIMMKTRVYPSFPKPAEIIHEINGTEEDWATNAWLTVIGAIRRHGSYESVSFDDKVIHSVIEAMGGWPQLCQTRDDDMKWRQKDFEGLYRVISRRDGQHPGHLPGLIEMDNRAKGYADHIPEPALVSGTTRKLIVYQGEG